MRIGYWTGWLDPQMVAVSKEVFQLMRQFPGSCAFGVSNHYMLNFSIARRSFGTHIRLYPLFRRLMPYLERRFDVSHVFTSLADWHFLSALGRRPIVLTVTQSSEPADCSLLMKVAHVAAETEQLASASIRAGVPSDRVSVVYPGVDLESFQKTAPPSRPWRGLFASSPENESEIQSKGVDLLLDLAAENPELQLTLLWRPFGRNSDLALEVVQRRNLPNIHVVRGRIPDMHRFYQQFHFTIAPFRGIGKPCPNSVLESLAAGRPALVSDTVDISALVASNGAGVTFSPDVPGICSAFRQLTRDYGQLQVKARPCAEQHFDERRMVREYDSIYRKVVTNGKYSIGK